MKRKKIKTGWKEYFNFSARERRGSIFLSLVIITQIAVLFIIRNSPSDFTVPDEKIIKSLLSASIDSSGTNEKSNNSNIAVKTPTVLFPFNPNNFNDSSGLKLGLSEKQMKVIKNYISHGGRFRVKKDFKKMYCITDYQYKILEPFIQLPDSLFFIKQKIEKTVLKLHPVDIGIADSIVLLNLRGIGPVLASRIVRYRDKLGGFVSMEQLKEVWGITDSLFETLLTEIYLADIIPYRFIHINTDTFDVLASHPYIKYKIAGLICNFRKQNKSFFYIDDLKKLPLISEENFRKLAPYIRLD